MIVNATRGIGYAVENWKIVGIVAIMCDREFQMKLRSEAVAAAQPRTLAALKACLTRQERLSIRDGGGHILVDLGEMSQLNDSTVNSKPNWRSVNSRAFPSVFDNGFK